MKQKFLRCNKCGNMVAVVKESGVPVMCCGEAMKEIIAGEVEHPMQEEHYIEWISIQTKFGNQRKVLEPNQKPEVCFSICEGDEVEVVYAYCNLHGLWKA